MNRDAVVRVRIGLILVYFVVADIAWQINNPIANEFTFFTHFSSAIKFETLPEFQIRRQ